MLPFCSILVDMLLSRIEERSHGISNEAQVHFFIVDAILIWLLIVLKKIGQRVLVDINTWNNLIFIAVL